MSAGNLTCRTALENLVYQCSGLPSPELERIIHLVQLLSFSTDLTKKEAETMILEIANSQPLSKDLCLASIDRIITYLRERLDGPDSTVQQQSPP